MDPSQNPNPMPPEGNYELQLEFLRDMQRDISAKLFESGASPAIIASTKVSAGVRTSVEGVDLLDKLCVPSRSMVTDKEHQEEQLTMTVVTEDTEKRSRSYTHYHLGRIDSAGILFPYPNVDPDAAEAVYAASRDIQQAKQDGLLPNLEFSLLSVHNPRTAIKAYRPNPPDGVK